MSRVPQKVNRMDDLISRQAAIDAIEEYAYRLQMLNWRENPSISYKAHALDWCMNTICDLPSAERRGRWVKMVERWSSLWKCDQCGEVAVETVMGKPRANYCPNCGAKMETTE